MSRSPPTAPRWGATKDPSGGGSPLSLMRTSERLTTRKYEESEARGQVRKVMEHDQLAVACADEGLPRFLLTNELLGCPPTRVFSHQLR